MKLNKLIKLGRVSPIEKTDAKGNVHIVAYQRKSGERYNLIKPVLVNAAPKTKEEMEAEILLRFVQAVEESCGALVKLEFACGDKTFAERINAFREHIAHRSAEILEAKKQFTEQPAPVVAVAVS